MAARVTSTAQAGAGAGAGAGASQSRPTKLPLIAPFESGLAISAALHSTDHSLLAAALHQIERDAKELEQKRLGGGLPKPALIDYIDANPRADGIFAAWDTANKSNDSQLSAAVLAALSSVVRLISSAPHVAEPQLIRRLVSDYGAHLDRALNPGRNDVTTAALRLACVLVGFGGGRFARRVFGCFSWSAKLTSRLYKTRLNAPGRDPLARPDIRTLLVMLVLSFLAVGDARLKGDLIETKGLVSGIFKGIADDPQVVVDQILTSFYEDAIADRSISLETRRSICEESSIAEVAKLFNHSSGEAVRASASRFLYAIAEWLAAQVNHSPLRSFGPQKALLAVLKSLNLTEDSDQRQLGLHILKRAPVIGGQFWAKFPSSLDPRLSSRWISAVTFAIQVVSLPVSQQLIISAEQSQSAPPSARSVMDNILPPSLNEMWYSKAIRHDNALVSFLSSLFLLAGLQKAAAVLDAIAQTSQKLEEDHTNGRWAQLGLSVRNHLSAVLPDPQQVIALMQKTAPELQQALRTNVALRLLFGYHRISPGLIGQVRFDFGKLPQAHLVPTEAEGLRAISSAYALRLSAIHSFKSSGSKPSEHFKSNVAPLFQLLKTESTAANRTLLLSNLSSVLDSPALLGPNNSPELRVWISAIDKQPPAAIAFFESVVHSALTAKLSSSVEKDQPSPVLTAFLAALEADAKAKAETTPELAGFVRAVALGMMGQSSSTKPPKKIVDAIKAAWEGIDAVKDSLKFVKDAIKALTRAVEVSTAASAKAGLLNPISRNVFAREAEDLPALLSSMSLELMALHVTPAACEASATRQAIVDRLKSATHSRGAAQVIVHRLANARWSDDESKAVVALLSSIDFTSADKVALAGPSSSLLAAFDSQMLAPELVTLCLDSILDRHVGADLALAEAFCDLIVADLTEAKSTDAIPERVLRSWRLVKFFPAIAIPALVESVLAKISPKKVASLDSSTVALLRELLERAVQSIERDQASALLDSNFELLNALATVAKVDSAKQLLALGAQSLLPFASNARKLGPDWHKKANGWADALLQSDSLDSSSGMILASVVYRSPGSRAKFIDWLNSPGRVQLEAAAPAITALLAVEAATGEAFAVNDSVAVELATSFLGAEIDDGNSSLEAIAKVVGRSTSASEAVAAAIEAAQPNAVKLKLLVTLAKADNLAFGPALSECVSEWLQLVVGDLTAEESLSPSTLSVLEQLCALLTGRGDVTVKNFVIEPVVSAVVSRRLREAEAVALATALVRLGELSSTQVTRLLNETFASGLFPKVSESVSPAFKCSIVRLVVALGQSFVPGAISSGAVDRTLRFYGGTLSADDRSLLSLFQSIESVSKTSISLSLAKWSPTADSVEGSRAATLGLCEVDSVRRAWQSAFKSSATESTLDSDELTYDPQFLLGFLFQTVSADELKPGEWMRIVESGALSLAIAALSSSDARLRKLGRATLAAAEAKLTNASFNESAELLLVISHARLCVPSAGADGLPALIGLFLAEALLAVGHAESSLYVGLNKFLLQRSTVDCFDVPMLYALLFSSEDDSQHDRRWLAQFLSRALVRSQDWKLFRRRQTIELCATLFESSPTDSKLRRSILAALVRASLIRSTAAELVKRHALGSLLTAQKAADAVERKLMTSVIVNLINAVGAEKSVNSIDLLDSLAGLVRSSHDEQQLNSTLDTLSRLLKQATATAALLSRIGSILHVVGQAIDRVSDAGVHDRFYSAVMGSAFAANALGLTESTSDRLLWTKARQSALIAGDAQLRAELIRILAN